MKKKDILYGLCSRMAITHPLLERGTRYSWLQKRRVTFPLLRGGRGCVIAALFTALILLSSACSTTKNLPEGEVLYTGIEKTIVTHEDETAAGDEALAEVKAALAYPPNNALLGSSSIRFPIPFGLWVYNAFVNKKGKLGRWIFDKLAAKPVFISTVNPEVRIKVAQNLLKEYGYFNGATAFQVDTNPKNDRKAKIIYEVAMNHPYTYDSIRYMKMRYQIDTLIRSTIGDRLIHDGENFNVTKLEAERQRISSLLRNNGFYYFRPEFITYQADTIMDPGKVALRVMTKPGLPSTALRPWRIGDISVWLSGYNNEHPTDSVHYKDITVHYQGKLRVRPSVLYNRLRFRSGDLYTQEAQQRTQTSYSRLGIFRYSEMQYTPKDSSRRQDTLDLRINTVYDLPLDGELEVNVTSKSNDQVGPGAIFSVSKRNMFGGGETFGVRLRGSYEWQTGNRVDGAKSAINSWEMGLSATLTFPQLLFPGMMQKDGIYPSSTSFRLYVDQLNRARFFKMLAFGGNAQYDFQSSATSHHSVTPFKLTYNLLQSTTHDFDSITDINKALKLSLENQFVPLMGYTYTYDDAPITTRRNHTWFQVSVSQAGNLIAAGYALAGSKFNEEGKHLLGNKFAQFVKGTAEIRYNYKIKHNQYLVGRLMAGAVYSYGNARVAPYNEQFYIGGANSLRAFTIRSIGPGRFHPEKTEYSYLDQTGDLKFEANLEYRFPILGDLHGATFVDSGNIWLLRNDPQRPGGQLKRGQFLRDLALDAGVGLRYDLTFIVIRLDMGIPLHVPYETDKSGYFNVPSYTPGWHLAIGYPF